MAETKYIKQLLSTGIGTEGQLLIPRKIHDVLIADVEKMLLPRNLAAAVIGAGAIPGSSYDFNLEVLDKMDVREVGEGAGIPLDQSEYTNINFKPKKYGVGIRITRELLEDAKFDLLNLNIRTAARRFAENENSLIISNALDDASNTVAGGAAVTIANLITAHQHLRDADFAPTDLIVGQEVLSDLLQIDTFVEADKSGSDNTLRNAIIGQVYGMQVHIVSTNAGMTKTSAYVIDRTQAYAIVEKRPITVETFDMPHYDMRAASITHRIAVGELRAQAIAKITSS